MVMAYIYTLSGQPDNAIDELDYLLSIESQYSANYLRVTPIFDRLRDNPRFQALLEKYRISGQV